MRALLIVNPKATTTSAAAQDVLAHALASEVKLDVAETTHRDHATELATQAAKDGLDLVVAFGGDGTVNEVVNGLLHEGPSDDAPSLAVVPAGSTNVFARALGMPNSAIEATAQLLDALLAERRRTVGLGMADDRYFTFNAGLGVDAGAVHRVEKARTKGRKATQALYVRCAVKEFYRGPGRRHPVVLERPGEEPLELHIALVAQTSPWTYLRDREVRPCPEASFDTGIDVFGLTKTPTLPTLRALSHMMSKDPRPRGKHVRILHDLPEFSLTCAVPLPFQLDGDGLGERKRLVLRAVPQALRVLV